MADDREFMHGVSLLQVGSQFLVIFSSNNYPPTSPPGDWTHDIFYSWLDPETPTLNVQTLISGVEAQEPVSAAINSLSRILVTSEDGSDVEYEVSQFAGMFSSTLTSLSQYPNIVIRRGGHSGHVAAFGDKHIVAYSEGWVDGGGFEGLGTGADVWARFVSGFSTLGSEILIASGRNWWPVIASSGNEALVVWQQYISDISLPKLMASIISTTGTVVSSVQLMPLTEYYNYEVRYMPELGQYLVIGRGVGGTYAILVSTTGAVTYTRTDIPQLSMREARFAVNRNTAVFPMDPSGVCVLDVTSSNITVRKTISGSVSWSYIGTDGIFLDNDRVLFAANTTTALRLMVASGLSNMSKGAFLGSPTGMLPILGVNLGPPGAL